MFNSLLIASVVLTQFLLGWSPSADRLTWALENAPVWIGLVLLAFTHRRFPLSRLCLVLLAIHAVILAVGGHYTYAKVPFGDWMKDWFPRDPGRPLGHAVGHVPGHDRRGLRRVVSGQTA